MAEPGQHKQPVASAKDRLIVALDVESAAEARSIVSELGGEVGAFKVGLQLFTCAGPNFVRELTEAGTRIFLDLKFHDIPNTVAAAAAEAAKLRVWMFNVHVLGGPEMLRRAAQSLGELCSKEGIPRPHLIGVTVLTSSDQSALQAVGIEHKIEDQVLRLARLASECGLDGVVASPLETSIIRKSLHAERFMIVTPGVRPLFATNDDQKRVTTPGEALSAGSDYIVIGRPIIQASDRSHAVRQILSEAGSVS
jgi:orotidine-5'-phosphate decarboxylase